MRFEYGNDIAAVCHNIVSLPIDDIVMRLNVTIGTGNSCHTSIAAGFDIALMIANINRFVWLNVKLCASKQ